MKHLMVPPVISTALVILAGVAMVFASYWVARANLVDSSNLFLILVAAFGLSAAPGWLRR